MKAPVNIRPPQGEKKLWKFQGMKSSIVTEKVVPANVRPLQGAQDQSVFTKMAPPANIRPPQGAQELKDSNAWSKAPVLGQRHQQT